jgi:hypothetical protein
MSEFKLKNTIDEGTKIMFWKHQLCVWLSIPKFYSHFTKVTRKCQCFGCIVEPGGNVIIYTEQIFIANTVVTLIWLRNRSANNETIMSILTLTYWILCPGVEFGCDDGCCNAGTNISCPCSFLINTVPGGIWTPGGSVIVPWNKHRQDEVHVKAFVAKKPLNFSYIVYLKTDW